ncbi:conserved hypothethical protein (plasmid) [Ralstonia solanacearum CMR15]|nr:conserved hypothethical protein [Ralstonia solanacearum CMR15]
MAPELEQEVTAMSREANNADFAAARIYRRDATIYQLSSTVNHIVGCWISAHFEPIPWLVCRGRNHMRECVPGKPEAEAYYAFVMRYFDAVEVALRSGGLWVDAP